MSIFIKECERIPLNGEGKTHKLIGTVNKSSEEQKNREKRKK